MSTISWLVRAGGDELVLTREFTASFLEEPSNTVQAAFRDQFGDPVTPDEPVEVLFEVHRVGAIDNPEEGRAPLVDRDYRGSFSQSVTIGEDGVATLIYARNAGDLGVPRDLAKHPTTDGADRDHIVVCLDPVDDACSSVSDGDTEAPAQVEVLDEVGPSAQVVHQWVLPDTTTSLGADILPGGALMNVLGPDNVVQDGRFGAVSDSAARGLSWGLINYRFNLRTALFQVGGGLYTTTPAPADGLKLREGGLDEVGRVILDLAPLEPMDPAVTFLGRQLSQMEQNEPLYAYTVDGEMGGTGFPFPTTAGKVQDLSAVRDLSELGGAMLIWAEDSNLPALAQQLAPPGSDRLEPSLPWYFDLETEGNPGGEIRGQLPVGNGAGDAGYAMALTFPSYRAETPPMFRYVEAAEETPVSSAQNLGLRFDKPVRNAHGDAFGPRAVTGDDFTVTVNGEPVAVDISAPSLATWDTFSDYHTISIDRRLEFGDQFTVEINPEAAALIASDDHYFVEPFPGGLFELAAVPRTLSNAFLTRSWLMGQDQARFTGVITDTVTGNAIPGAEISLWTTDETGQPDQQLATTLSSTWDWQTGDVDGEYTLTAELPTRAPDEYVLTVTHESYEDFESQFTLASGHGQQLDIELQPFGLD